MCMCLTQAYFARIKLFSRQRKRAVANSLRVRTQVPSSFFLIYPARQTTGIWTPSYTSTWVSEFLPGSRARGLLRSWLKVVQGGPRTPCVVPQAGWAFAWCPWVTHVLETIPVNSWTHQAKIASSICQWSSSFVASKRLFVSPQKMSHNTPAGWM